MFAKQTSLITILSSEHGRLRREQRDIDKRDLQKALKYGTRSRVWGQRWKVEYDGVVFITNSTLREEITAYPSPLALAPHDYKEVSGHSKAKHVIDCKPELCKSHTVLVVDNSGSMMTHDINLHRDRQTAAYTNVALEFVAEQLFNGTSNNSDVVSLVEFKSSATVIFEREPASWVLYNKILKRRDSRNHVDRERHRIRESCSFLSGDSNYLPALEIAEKLLAKESHDECALSLMFLSDGAPTDAQENGLTPLAAQRRIRTQMEGMATRFGGQLSVLTIGFGNQLDDFSVLEQMAEACNSVSPETKAQFIYCDKISSKIGSAVSSLVTNITETRTSLMQGRATTKYTKRVVAMEENGGNVKDYRYYKILDHFARYDPKTKEFLHSSSLPPGAWRKENHVQFTRRVKQVPPFLAISTKHCGSGAERFAFRCSLADDFDPNNFVLGSMVAKETNAVERVEENVEFHKTFLETQSLASHLAKEFNKRLTALSSYDERRTPLLVFLECSVLKLDDPSFPAGSRGVLLEKMLDTDHFQWTKWNDNAGTVDGRIAHVPIDVDFEMAKMSGGSADLGDIAEGDSDDEEEDSDDDLADNFESIGNTRSPSDYLQAFTHFTYLFTNKKVMVCDLQGVYNEGMVPPTFELTDPAIHYRSSRREMVYGRTDKGRKGMDLFFHTHKCTDICKMMSLSTKKMKWRKQWHEAALFNNIGT